MATYNTAFGSLPGYNEQLGTTNTTGGGQQQTYNPQAQQRQTRRQQYGGGYQTFSQMQQQGYPRPARPPQQERAALPQGQSGAAGIQAMDGQVQYYRQSEEPPSSNVADQFKAQLQRNLQGFMAAPSRYGTEEFQQVRGAQAANLQAEYQGQQQALNEELARRGLSASSIGGGRMGDLAGQQARALSTLDANLLREFATTQAADRLSALQEASKYMSQEQLNELKMGELTGMFGGQATLAAQEAENQRKLQEAALTGTYGGGKTLAAEEQAAARELAIAGLTGQYKGQQTQAAKQFDIEQALKEKLGLGGLSLEQQKINEQARQFGLTLDEQKASRLQQYGLSVQDLGLKAQQLKQEAELQGRQMSITEAQYIAQNKLEADKLRQQATEFGLTLDEQKAGRLQQYDISSKDLALKTMQVQQQNRSLDLQEAQNLAQNELEKQKIKQQGEQFGLSLDEQKAARMQQNGFTIQELALKTKEVENQAKLEGRRLDLTEAQNLALNTLERDKLNADKDYRAQQLGLNRDELNLKADQIKQEFGLRGQEIDNEKAYREAEIQTRTTQIANEFLRSGQQITLDEARLKAQQDMAALDNKAQMERLDKQLKEQGRQFDLENQLKKILGMSEVSGYVYDPETGKRTTAETVQGQVARNQMMLQLAQILQNSDLANAFKNFSTTQPPYTTKPPTNTSQPPVTTTPPITGQTTTTPPTTSTVSPWSNWAPQLDANGYLTKASAMGTPMESVFDTPKTGVRYKIGGYGVFYDGTGWKVTPLVD
jgi:hypothetical protein